MLAERPHLTWADTDVWNEAWEKGPGGGFRPRASHAAFPCVQTLASLKLDSREGRRLPEREESLEAFPSVCSLLLWEAAAPKSLSGASAGILSICVRYLESLEPITDY